MTEKEIAAFARGFYYATEVAKRPDLSTFIGSPEYVEARVKYLSRENAGFGYGREADQNDLLKISVLFQVHATRVVEQVIRKDGAVQVFLHANDMRHIDWDKFDEDLRKAGLLAEYGDACNDLIIRSFM